MGIFVTLTACLASGQTTDRVLDDVQGEASYYADKFAGRTTANGETFDPSEMTAAHRELPFDSRVRVTRVGEGASVTVRINDRGPYAGNRIIDLSEAAAQQIGMIQEGVVEVRLEVLSTPGDSKVTSSNEPAAREARSRDPSSAASGW
jgi:rare lipoprotein A